MNIDRDIIIDTNNEVYKKLSSKIKSIKKKGLPLLIKVNSHPCGGKGAFIDRNNGVYKGCTLYDFDDFPEGDGKKSDMLLKEKSNSILLGCSGGNIERPNNREKDYDIHENVIYIFVIPKLERLYKNIVMRQLELEKKTCPWRDPQNILSYRNSMWDVILNKKKQQIRPLFYSFEEGVNYCLNEYNK